MRYTGRMLMFITLFVVLSAADLIAGTNMPWKWQLDLRGDKPVNNLVMPASLYVDAARQRYYVVDTGNNRLVSFDRGGKFINAFNAQGNLKAPTALVRDSGDRLWVIESGRNSLTRIDLKARKTVPHQLKYKGELVYPDRLVRHGKLLYVLDKATGVVLAYDKQMKAGERFSSPAGEGGFIDFKIHGNTLWALVPGKKTLYGFGLNGKLKKKIVLESASPSFPFSFDIEKSGFVYVLDRHDGSVSVFGPKGRFRYSFLGTGQVRGKLYYPSELQFDPWGRLCVVDEGNGRVEILSR